MEKVSVKQTEYITFTLEEEIIHHLMLKTAFLKRNGLLHGKLGIAITFFECGRYWNKPIYTSYANELKDSFPDKIDDKVTRDFATGLSGFGWGIEYLTQHQYIDCNSNNICTYIDDKVMSIDIRRINDLSLETGLEGFLHYILIRIEGARMQKKSRPFDEIYLKDTYNRLQALPEENVSGNLCILKQSFISYMDTGSLIYKPNICSFTNDLSLKNEEDILSAKLGLFNGLAGKLLRIIYDLNELKYL